MDIDKALKQCMNVLFYRFFIMLLFPENTTLNGVFTITNLEHWNDMCIPWEQQDETCTKEN